MKKIVIAAVISAFLGLSAQADFIRVEAGGGAWNNEISGSAQHDGEAAFKTSTLGYADESKGYLWMFIKHPIPLLPNVRLEYADVGYSGTSNGTFAWDGNLYGEGSTSTLDLAQIDAILYYNILDNLGWVTLDLGIDAKYIDASFKGEYGANSFDDSESIVLPLGYARARFQIPMTDIGIEGDVKYIAYGDSRLLDYRIKVDYTLVNVLPFDVGLEVGYRFENLDLDSDDVGGLNSTLDVEIDGFFAGAVLRF